MVSPNRDMTEIDIKLRLSREAHQILSERAKRTGQPLDAVASELVERATTPSTVSPAEREARLAAFERLMEHVAARARNYPPGFEADDSRESIYDDSGE